MAFAKLYGTDKDQILVTIDSDSDSKPQVKFSFVPEGLGVCSTGPAWTDDDAGWDKAEAFFEKVKEKQAREFVDIIKGQITDGV